jgi:hypothetical protein
MSETWRDGYRREIAAAIVSAEALGLEGPARERYVRSATRPSMRGCWPYRVWCSEVAFQLRGRPRRRGPESPRPLFGE